MRVIISSILLALGLSAQSCVLEDLQSSYRMGISSVSTEISLLELKYLYSGKFKELRNGEQVTIFVKPYDDFEQMDMVAIVLGRTMSRFIEHVNKNDNIKVIKRDEILGKMQVTPYSIGIIGENEIYIRGEYGVSVLRVTRR